MALKVTGLSKTYPEGVTALKDLTLTIGNHMFGLLGVNGAGIVLSRSVPAKLSQFCEVPDASSSSNQLENAFD